VVDILARHRPVPGPTVGKAVGALVRLLDELGRRGRGARIDPHPVRRPAVLEAECSQLGSEIVIGRERPAADLAHAVVHGETNGADQIRAWLGEGNRGAPAAEVELDSVELDTLAAAPEPRSMAAHRIELHADDDSPRRAGAPAATGLE